MEQFAAVALAHFLALLIPGVDFFLIARTAMTSGWRNATGACLGIAAANGIFIAAAFSGILDHLAPDRARRDSTGWRCLSGVHRNRVYEINAPAQSR